jgi:hypothetical protein
VDWPQTDKPILIATVMNTGTHSAKKWAEEIYPEKRIVSAHCSVETLDRCRSGEYFVVSTYRDPVETLYSWLKRTEITHLLNKLKFAWSNYIRTLRYVDFMIAIENLKYKENSYQDAPARDELTEEELAAALRVREVVQPLVEDKL